MSIINLGTYTLYQIVVVLVVCVRLNQKKNHAIKVLERLTHNANTSSAHNTVIQVNLVGWTRVQCMTFKFKWSSFMVITP